MYTRLLIRASCVAGLLLIQACGGTTDSDPGLTADLSQEWQTASPASQGLDPAGVADAVAHASTLPGFSAFWWSGMAFSWSSSISTETAPTA